MGVKCFGSSSMWSPDSENPKDIEPKSDKFQIIWAEEIGDFLLTKILYPNCENYNGYKILVYHKISERQLRNTCLLDPHFSSTDEISPIARFKPTWEGVEMAKRFCNM